MLWLVRGSAFMGPLRLGKASSTRSVEEVFGVGGLANTKLQNRMVCWAQGQVQGLNVYVSSAKMFSASPCAVPGFGRGYGPGEFGEFGPGRLESERHHLRQELRSLAAASHCLTRMQSTHWAGPGPSFGGDVHEKNERCVAMVRRGLASSCKVAETPPNREGLNYRRLAFAEGACRLTHPFHNVRP